MPVFRRDRAARPDASISAAPDAAGDLVRDAETIVHLAWRRDLYDMRILAEELLQAAVADSLQAYEALHQAQRDRLPGAIVEAHMRFEAATRLTQTRTDNRDRIDALIAADFDDGAAPSPAPPAVTVLARVRRLTAAIWGRICSRSNEQQS